VLAWTVDDPGVRQRLMEAGVDAIITNDSRPYRQEHDEIE